MINTVAVAAIAQAIKASGAIIQVEPEVFRTIIENGENILIVVSIEGIFVKTHNYLTNYKGFFFHTRCKNSLELPIDIELIKAQAIWIPG